ncbi:MAG: hypothetical protein ACKVPX_10625 [Myxococcaceae bacterium]
MAYLGEVVRMANGRWARFEAFASIGAPAPAVLAAVELEERFQQALDAAQPSLEQYRKEGSKVRLRLETDAAGGVHVRFASDPA